MVRLARVNVLKRNSFEIYVNRTVTSGETEPAEGTNSQTYMHAR
jgi:hypothetical protein